MVEADRQLLQMREEIVPNVVFDVASGVEDQRAGESPEDALADAGDGDKGGVIAYVPESAALLDDLDRGPHEPRDPHDERYGAEKAERPEEIAPPIAQHITPEPSHSRSEEHTSELQSHSFISYAVFC